MRLLTPLIAVLSISTLVFGDCSTLGSGWKRECQKKKCFREYFNMEIGTGYRQDSYHFEVANDVDGTIPVAREMHWKRLRILPFTGYADYRHPCGFIVKFYGDYGRIYDGKASTQHWVDSDTVDLREKGDAGRGSIWDLGAGLGYSFTLIKDAWTLNPLIGYDHNQQYYQIYKVQREFGPFQGLLGGQHHSYQSLWRGPWVGFESECGPWFCENFWLRFGGGWHYMLFRANLKDTFPLPTTDITFRCLRKQQAYGWGYDAWAGIDYYCNKTWSIGAWASYKGYTLGSGNQYSNCNDSTLNRKVKFTGGNWYSTTILLTLGYHWQ